MDQEGFDDDEIAKAIENSLKPDENFQSTGEPDLDLALQRKHS